MKVEIDRASAAYGNPEQPVDGAVSVESPWGGKCWFIDMESLDDLMRLLAEEGDLVVRAPNPDNPNAPLRITVYDDYME